MNEVINVPVYEADEGKVFDWLYPRYDSVYDENGNIVPGELQRIHLYAKTIYLYGNDKIEYYIQVQQPE